jgi:hypothetical protein
VRSTNLNALTPHVFYDNLLSISREFFAVGTKLALVKHKKKLWRLCRRLLWSTTLMVWLCVTVVAFGFHHHSSDEEDCNKTSCPFALVSANLPDLPSATAVLLLPELSTCLPSGKATVIFTCSVAAVAVRGPPKHSIS